MKRTCILKSCLFIISIAFLLSSCDCYEEPGIVTSESRELAEFNALDVESIGKVNLYAAEEFKIIIKTHENIINDILTSVVDNKLTIRLSGNHRRIKTLEFDVFAPSYSLIEQNDVADIKCIDGFTSNELTILQNDVGNINLHNLNLQNLQIALNDVGNVELSGVTQDIIASLDGIGDIHLFKMNCITAEVDLDGTGDIEINASESLDVHLSGVGNVYYKGSPKITINKTGVGKVVNVN